MLFQCNDIRLQRKNAEKRDNYTPVPDDESLAFRDLDWLPSNYIFTIYEAPSEPIAETPNPVRFWPIFREIPRNPLDSSLPMSI